MTRVSADDLAFAADWLDSYEAQDDDNNGEAAHRVAAWLRAEINRRADAATLRAIAAQTGGTLAQARAALAKARASSPKPSTASSP